MYSEITDETAIELLKKDPTNLALFKSISSQIEISLDIVRTILTLNYWVWNDNIQQYRRSIITNLDHAQIIKVLEGISLNDLERAVIRITSLDKMNNKLLSWLINKGYINIIDKLDLDHFIDHNLGLAFAHKSIPVEKFLTILDLFLSYDCIKDIPNWWRMVHEIKQHPIGQQWCVENLERISFDTESLRSFIWRYVNHHDDCLPLYNKVICMPKVVYAVLDEGFRDYGYIHPIEHGNLISDSALKLGVTNEYNVLSEYIAADIAQIIMQHAYPDKYTLHLKNLHQQNIVLDINQNTYFDTIKSCINPHNSNYVLFGGDIGANTIRTIKYPTLKNKITTVTDIIKFTGSIITKGNPYVLLSASLIDITYALYSKDDEDTYGQVVLSTTLSLLGAAVLIKGLLLISPYTLTTLYAGKVIYNWYRLFTEDYENSSNSTSGIVDTENHYNVIKDNTLLSGQCSNPNISDADFISCHLSKTSSAIF